ncbi:hypothetical protein SAMN05216474_0355 [Lishizhenia tianjinensis]|uniref:Lipoprotein n=1 Tax=Lishizhenia tianjinensis TaxID=477690 RepID=A0A1I6XP19_9FLAO|nr:hypothetical protein [Lishizhenia tianjinensis]SFT40125.1 hypothetical protein SAMN05216474_0355 [Lishizhenia tianjinensis]
MKIYLIFVLAIITSSCGQGTKTEIEDVKEITTTSQPEKNQTKTNEIEIDDLKGKVFEIGSKTHFTDTCAFYFECDCCSGELIFEPGMSFYYLDFCMSDQTLRKGNYKIENGYLVMNYGTKCVSRQYNYQNEIDTSAVDFFMTDTIVKEITVTYSMTLCENKIKLTNQHHEEVAIEVKSNFSESIKYLNSEGFLERID